MFVLLILLCFVIPFAFLIMLSYVAACAGEALQSKFGKKKEESKWQK